MKKNHEKKSWKKSTKKTKWNCQNSWVILCQTLNTEKYWIEVQNQKEKSNSQKNPKHKKKKQRKTIFNELNDNR